jgi:hypothetical protein
MSILPVYAKMKSLRQEHHASRIAIYAIKAYSSITLGVTKEIDTLVCVG